MLASTYRSAETSRGKATALIPQYLNGKQDNIEDDIDKIKAVTIEKCNEVIGRLFDHEQFNWAVMNPKV